MAEPEALPRIDHIIIGAQDLKAAVDHFYNEYGLAAYHGGKHQVSAMCRAGTDPSSGEGCMPCYTDLRAL